jgi:hypothetical protein
MISTANLVRLPAFIASSCDVNAIVDTPQGSQNKFKFDEQTGLFALGGAMPGGSVFPLSLVSFLRRLAEMAIPSIS